MEYVPGLSLLVAFLFVANVLQRKFTGERLTKLLDGKNFLLFCAVFLFCILLIVHLLKEQTWTADLLKVIAGVLVGAGANYTSNEDKGKGNTLTAIGQGNLQAMGSVITEMKGDISQLKDSIVNQNQTIQQIHSAFADHGNEEVASIKRTDSLRIESQDKGFIAELSTLQKAGGDWTHRWIDMCLSRPEFQERINEKIKSLQNEGWRTLHLELDNHNNGLHINFELEKIYNATYSRT